MNPTRRWFVAASAALTLGLAACSSGGTTEVGSPSPESSAPAGGDSAGSWPALVAPTASGGQLDLGDLEGTDVVLWYWAPW